MGAPQSPLVRPGCQAPSVNSRWPGAGPRWPVAPPSETRSEIMEPWLILQPRLPPLVAPTPGFRQTPDLRFLGFQWAGPPSASPRLAGRTHQWGARGGGPRAQPAGGRPADPRLAVASASRGGGAAGKAPTCRLGPSSLPQFPNCFTWACSETDRPRFLAAGWSAPFCLPPLSLLGSRCRTDQYRSGFLLRIY